MKPKVRYKEFRLVQMRTFCAVVRHGSFAAAAKALGASHPVVWQQVRALERDLGVALVERAGRGVRPTDDGAAFYELAGEVVAAMDAIRQTFDDRREGRGCRLVVAGLATLFAQDLAEVTVEYCRAHPRVRVTLRTNQHREIEDVVAEGEAHVAVLTQGSAGTNHPRLTAEVIYRREWGLFVPAGHPLARRTRVAAADLARHPLVLADPGNPWRDSVDAVFRQAGFADRPPVALEVGNPIAALRFASLGLGPTIVPYPPRGVAPPDLVQRSLAHLFPPEYLVAMWRKGARPRPQARAFVDFARERLGGL